MYFHELVNLFFFFNDTATTETYTPFPPRRSSDLIRERVLEMNLIALQNEAAGLGEEQPLQPPAVGRLSEMRVPTLVVDRKSTRLNSSHANISYAVFCLKKKNISSLLLQHKNLHCH